MPDPFFKGLVFGLSLAAPVGPIGLLCIKRTLANGRLAGFLSGLGAATADMCYGAVAAFGLTVVSTRLVGGAVWLRGLGGLFLAYLGIRIFFSRPAQETAALSGGGYLAAYLSTFLLTLANPMTIMSFAALLAGSGPFLPALDRFGPFRLVAGVFCGSALWWLILSTGIGAARGHMDTRALGLVNRVSGAAITIFAFTILVGLHG